MLKLTEVDIEMKIKAKMMKEEQAKLEKEKQAKLAVEADLLKAELAAIEQVKV